MFQNTSCALKYDRASGNLNQFSPEFKIFHVDLLLLIGNDSECLCVLNVTYINCKQINTSELNAWIFIESGSP